MDAVAPIAILVGIIAGLLLANHLWKTTPVSVVIGGVAWMWAQVKTGSAIFGGAAGIVAFLVSYLIHCMQRPRQVCLWCGGDANRKDSTGKNSRYCWWCQGRGKKLRMGSRLWKSDD